MKSLYKMGSPSIFNKYYEYENKKQKKIFQKTKTEIINQMNIIFIVYIRIVLDSFK